MESFPLSPPSFASSPLRRWNAPPDGELASLATFRRARRFRKRGALCRNSRIFVAKSRVFPIAAATFCLRATCSHVQLRDRCAPRRDRDAALRTHRPTVVAAGSPSPFPPQKAANSTGERRMLVLPGGRPRSAKSHLHGEKVIIYPTRHMFFCIRSAHRQKSSTFAA